LARTSGATLRQLAEFGIVRTIVERSDFLRLVLGETQSDYVVKQTGSDKIVHYCQRNALALPGGTLAGPEMICGGLAYNFTFNFETLRFRQFHGIGYTAGDFPGNTPYIMIGKCTKL
jgi:hypothetical protein